MRMLLAVTLSLVSLSSCASNELSGVLADAQPSSIVAQKAQESGIVFMSSGDQYQLILDGRAVKDGTSVSGLSASQGGMQKDVLWEGANGAFNLTISNSDAEPQGVQALSSGGNYNQIAYNARTGGVAIITGQIIVSYTDGFDSEFLESSYGIQLIQDFAHLKTAFYTVNAGQDIFLITDYLNQGGLVTKAEVEVIENFSAPL